MNCIIIEDQPPAQRLLAKYIEDFGTLQLAGTFSNGLEALDFLRSNQVDLIFLDIHLPKMSGIDFLGALTQTPYVILTTAFPDYALQSYEFAVVDYLLKPFSFQRFAKAVGKVPPGAPTTGAKRTEVFIKSGYEYVKIKFADILYIKSDADYTEIMIPDKKYLSAEPLRYWLEILDRTHFARIHKSYIVNVERIEKVSGNQIYLTNKNTIPIGRVYKEEFMTRFMP